ncbi:hypothetical protein K438DRAFT_2020693 [Mycena galopus ATCC 62051]|nr:hypothetical protein K438DRAFT_2020693 [Mycena galopus ATCC 62051]
MAVEYCLVLDYGVVKRGMLDPTLSFNILQIALVLSLFAVIDLSTEDTDIRKHYVLSEGDVAYTYNGACIEPHEIHSAIAPGYQHNARLLAEAHGIPIKATLDNNWLGRWTQRHRNHFCGMTNPRRVYDLGVHLTAISALEESKDRWLDETAKRVFAREYIGAAGGMRGQNATDWSSSEQTAAYSGTCQ